MLAAARGEVLEVLHAGPVPAPAPADRLERTHARRCPGTPSRAGTECGRRTGRSLGATSCPPLTYGFSIGLKSIARPYACSDHRLVPSTYRQLNADVLSASIDRKSLAPYVSTGTMRRIGKCAACRRRSTEATSDATSRWTMMRPVCSRPSNPQCRAVTTRRSRRPTGQPGRHETPVIVRASEGPIG